MRIRRAGACLALLVAACSGDRASGGGGGITRIEIDTVPELDLGVVEGDTSELFSQVVGATRLPDGTIIVGDRGSAQLRYFSREGRFIRGVGRKGTGPGEFDFMARMLRCGDSVFVYDIGRGGNLVFGVDGGYGRMLQHQGATPGDSPYRSACNDDRLFFHYGWGDRNAPPKVGVYRDPATFWMTAADGSVRQVMGSLPGSERLGRANAQGRPTGSRPLPLGKETAIALGRDRAFVGTADAYEILVLDFTGTPVDTLRKANVDLRTTPEDIELYKLKDLSQSNPVLREQNEREYLTIPFPERIPAYAAFKVDRRGNLWVQDFPRGTAPLTRWSIFSPDGLLVGETYLPARLEVYEIGGDYVLGKALEPPDDVEHVRVYRLRREPGA